MINYKTVFTAFSAVLLGGSAMAQSVDLTMKWKPDHQYNIKQVLDMDMTLPKPQDGGDTAVKRNMVLGMQGASSVHENGIMVDMKIDAISMDMAVAGNKVISYDSAKPNAENPVDKAMGPMLNLNFKTLYGKDGKFLEIKDFNEKLLIPEIGFTKASLENMMKQASKMIPDGEVEVGAIWASVIKVPMQGFENGFSCNYDFKLASLKEVEGRQVARIEFSADMEKVKVKQHGMDLLMSAKNIEGYYLFDVKEGQFTEVKTFFNMVADALGMEMVTKMNLRLEFSNEPLKK